MATKKVASLNSGLLARKGEASPAPVVTQPPASEGLVKLTVKLTPEEYQQLVMLGMYRVPRLSNQAMLHEAVVRFLESAKTEPPDVLLRAIERRGGQRRGGEPR